MASSSPEAIDWSASNGYAILMDPHSPHETIAKKFMAYRHGLSQHGHTLDQDTPIARLIAIGKTDAEGEALARAGATWTVTSYLKTKRDSNPDDHDTKAESDPVKRYIDDVIVHGSVDKVIYELQRLEEEIPLNYLLASPLSHETFIRLTDKVMPALA